MKRPTLHLRLSSRKAAFIVAALLTFGAGWFTRLDKVGPGLASAWSSAALAAGQPADAARAPLFRLLMLTAGQILPANQAHIATGIATLLGMALFAGLLAGLLTSIFQRWGGWSPFTAGCVGALLVASSRLPWAVSLSTNPAPWSLAALAGAWWLLLDRSEANSGHHQALLGAFLASLAATFHTAALLAWPATMMLTGWRAYRDRTPRLALYIVTLLPFTLFLLPSMSPTLLVSGFLEAARGIPNGLSGIELVGWAALFTITPIGLLFALYGTVLLARRGIELLVPLLLLLLGIVAGAILGGVWAQFAALLASVLVMTIAVLALGNLAQRLPTGSILVLWLLLPLVWIFQGRLVSRHGEVIWKSHVRNVVRTARYKSVILSTDEKTVNCPTVYLSASMNLRPDIILVNPLRLTDPGYLNWINGKYHSTLGTATLLFDSLRTSANRGAPADTLRPLASKMLSVWVEDEVEKSGTAGGVLVSPGFDPGTTRQMIPEGLLMRVWKGDIAYPFVFRLLNLDPIHFAPHQTMLERGVIAQYPMMFTARGTWMMKRNFMLEGTDYIRHALKIDPSYIPARIAATEYGIHGEPLRLGKDKTILPDDE